MFIYLSKKIAIPNGTKLESLAWNAAQGWIACGGSNGLTKVLKLEAVGGGRDASSPPPADGGRGAPPGTASGSSGSNLTMNQTLEGHEGSVVCVIWNSTYSKLTTCDEHGLIIVWMLHKGLWFEEMINNRNKSAVRDMKWTSNGQKICIIYADGAVIVGSVDGNRLWGKELETGLQNVEWSPDGRRILFVSTAGEVLIYDAQGKHVRAMPLPQGTQASPAGGRKGVPSSSASPAAGRGNSKNADDDDDDDDSEDDEKEDRVAKGGVSGAGAERGRVIAVHWYDGAEGLIHQRVPTLCLAFDSGIVQLSRGVDDPDPVVVDAHMAIRKARWNSNGTVLALSGSARATMAKSGESRDLSVLKLFSPYGVLLRTLKLYTSTPRGHRVLYQQLAMVLFGLRTHSPTIIGFLAVWYRCTYYCLMPRKVPGNGISSLAWEGNGLRIALTVDAYIYFANIRPDYAWASASGARVLAYAYQKADRVDTQLCFWDLESGERRVKQRRDLRFLFGGGDHFCLVTGPNEQERYVLTLMNSIGCPLETRLLPGRMNPSFGAMSSTHVVVACDRFAYVWQYKHQAPSYMGNDPATAIAVALKRASGAGAERIVDPDKTSTPSCAPEAYGGTLQDGTKPNPVIAVAVSECTLVLGRENGTIYRYTLPHIGLENRYSVRIKAQQMALNCNSSLLAIIDAAGALTVLDLEAKGGNEGPDVDSQVRSMDDFDRRISLAGDDHGVERFLIQLTEAIPAFDRPFDADNNPPGDISIGAGRDDAKAGPWAGFERRDAWDIVWATDDPNQLAAMEKAKLVVFNSAQPEEPVPSTAHLCRLQGLEARTVILDEIMAAPDTPDRSLVVDVETRVLQEAREMMTTEGLQEAYQAIVRKPHTRLWKLLAEQALEALDLGMAEKAFVQCGKDAYRGVRLVQRLKTMTDRIRRRAEVSIYSRRYDEAENLYREIDRKDLAISLRERLGDWFRVVQLMKQGGGDDEQLSAAWGKLGTYYTERGKWAKAVQYFKQAKDLTMMAECYYRLEDFQSLRELVDTLPREAPGLAELGAMFESVGLAEDAVRALLRLGNPKAAIDACVRLNHWERAVELAERYEFPQIETLLSRHASQLLKKGDCLQAVEVYRMAGKATDAALLLAKLAEDAGGRDVNPLQAKKLHVLAALEVERHRKRTLGGAGISRQQDRSASEVAAATAATLDTLMMVTASDSAQDKRAAKVLDSAWRGAEAYHYHMLAQRQFYHGKVERALRTAIRCAEFEDILSPWDVYCLVALTAYHSGFMGVCSRAFVKLETLPDQSDERLEAAQSLALKIFTRNSPVDPEPLESHCLECLDEGTSYQACTASGQVITSRGRALMCRTCRHFAIESELGKRSNCPLCHASLR